MIRTHKVMTGDGLKREKSQRGRMKNLRIARKPTGESGVTEFGECIICAGFLYAVHVMRVYRTDVMGE